MQQTADKRQETRQEQKLRELYEQPHTTRERHYGLMERSPAPAEAGQTTDEGSIPVQETIELREAAILSPERREVEVTVLEAGVSRNGWSYSPQLLQAATPLFEGARAFADHPGPADRAERSIRDIVGWYHSPRFEPAADGQPARIKATLRVLESSQWLWTMIAEAVADGQPFVGLSVDFVGAVKPGKRGAAVREVQAIRQLLSVDVVTRPSAGGRFERILNSEELMTEEQTLTPALSQEEREIIGEAQRLLLEAQRERRIAECARTLDGLLAATKLPDPFRDKLRKRFAGGEADAQTIQEAIDDETDALASVAAEGLITGMGADKASITGTRTEVDRFQTALDILLGVDVSEAERTSTPKLSGIREAYIVATGDPDIHGATDFERALIREADTTTSSFGFLLGTSMNKRLLKEYQAWPNEWVKFASVVPIKDFKQQDRIRLASFGSLPVVAEDSAYTTVSLSDTRAIYRASKYGQIVAVSREVIVNDDLQAIRQIPQKLAVAAAYTLAEFVYGFLSGGRATNIYDGNLLFDAAAGPYNHGHNRRVDALATAGLTTGITTMKEQTNMAGKRIGLKPSFLVVPPELEFTALQLIKSGGLPGGNQNDINPVMGYCEVIVSPQLANTLEWYLIADPRMVDTVEVGFVGGQVNPVLLVQDQPLFGLNFTQDVISYKVRHEYGGAVVDYRGFYSGGD
ncbi:MAG TPA: Mu-like prophage major head subunit gpT family protein [Chloroflexota bacterium]|nr:Mu-like prophage major head subunit gpT family protein [Chloroflexota bacterium]